MILSVAAAVYDLVRLVAESFLAELLVPAAGALTSVWRDRADRLALKGNAQRKIKPFKDLPREL